MIISIRFVLKIRQSIHDVVWRKSIMWRRYSDVSIPEVLFKSGIILQWFIKSREIGYNSIHDLLETTQMRLLPGTLRQVNFFSFGINEIFTFFCISHFIFFWCIIFIFIWCCISVLTKRMVLFWNTNVSGMKVASKSYTPVEISMF